MKPISTAPACWTERYETLRRHVVDHRQSLGADPLGLALLLRQGLASWMRFWSEAASPTASSSPSPVASPPPCLPTPEWQQQLTELLTQMTSAHLPTASTL